MPRVAIPVTNLDPNGVDPTSGEVAGDPANDHVVASGNDVFLLASNDDGAVTHDVVLQTPRTADGVAIEEVTVTVPISGQMIIGPLRPSVFAQPSGADAGKVYVDVASASLRLAGFRV